VADNILVSAATTNQLKHPQCLKKLWQFVIFFNFYLSDRAIRVCLISIHK